MSKKVKQEHRSGRIKRTRGQEIWYQFKKNKGAVAALIVFVLFIAIAIFAQFYYDYDEDIVNMNPMQTLQAPSRAHPFGTDHMGRDVFARVFYGARYSLVISLTTVLISTFFGILLGSIAGYYGGVTESFLMRLVDIFTMIPSLLLTIILVSVLGVSIPNLVIALSIGGIPSMARVVRAAVLPIRNSEYVESARSLGVSDLLIILTHVLPNCLSPIIVNMTIRVGTTIISTATYSFLGLGVPTPTPEWGAMLSDGRAYMRDHANLILAPGFAIMVTALCCNLIGDGLRDALDPKLRK